MKKKVLVIGDSPTVNTGFGTVVNNLFTRLYKNEKYDIEWDVVFLGINYYGDPHEMQKQFTIYPPVLYGKEDVYGLARIRHVMAKENPDVIFILNDIWLTAEYVLEIRKFNQLIPVVIYTPIDSDNIKPEYTKPLENEVAALVTYTEYGRSQIEDSGYEGRVDVIGHGVDRTKFKPIPQELAREKVLKGLPLKDPFIVLYVARNNPRKRIDLWIYTIKKWLDKYPHDNVYMHYHGATRDIGIDVEQYAHKVGLGERLILTARNINPSVGIPVETLNYLYSCADLYFHACAVAGFELPVAEAMQCKIPILVPDYSALSEWPRGAVHYVNIRPEPWLNPGGVNTIHRFLDVDHAVEQLEMLYQDDEYRKELAERGFNRIQEDRFSWDVITDQFNEVLSNALNWKKSVKNKGVVWLR